jgi:hypothetical protein
MKTRSPFGNSSLYKGNKISNKLSSRLLNKIGEKSGYKKRNSGKISARTLIVSFMMMISKNRNTYESWAQEISLGRKSTVSKQAIEERMGPETTNMVKMTLEEELRKSLLKQRQPDNQSVQKFKSIQIEDSTTIKLPDELSFAFSGNVSKGKKKSQIKIHALFDLSHQAFRFMDLHGFTRNDQSLAAQALTYLEPGDLLLRDMGFLVLDVLDRVDKLGVYFISRKKSKIKVFDPETGQEIDLIKELRKKKTFDKIVLVSKSKKSKMRLVIVPLTADQAAERRRKARRDRDRRLNHSQEYYELLGYMIFITNIPSSCCNTQEIKMLYGLRWHIEIIFKAWKSCFSMEKLIPSKCKKPDRIYCMIYLWLLYIVLFHVVWLRQIKSSKIPEVNLSLLKMARFFSMNFSLVFSSKSQEFIKDLIIAKCSYDKRFDRINMSQKYLNVLA